MEPAGVADHGSSVEGLQLQVAVVEGSLSLGVGGQEDLEPAVQLEAGHLICAHPACSTGRGEVRVLGCLGAKCSRQPADRDLYGSAEVVLVAAIRVICVHALCMQEQADSCHASVLAVRRPWLCGRRMHQTACRRELQILLGSGPASSYAILLRPVESHVAPASVWRPTWSAVPYILFVQGVRAAAADCPSSYHRVRCH